MIMKVLAILATRNEENYINYCLKSLIEQNLDVYLIDNDSNDKTVEIAKKYLGKGLIEIKSIKHKGYYEFLPILKKKEQLAQQLNYDWFMHVDADEIYEAPKEYKNLYEGIKDADEKGYNVINFEEFVFIPKNNNEKFEGKDYTKLMNNYYFFEPRKNNLGKLWKKNIYADIITTCGHNVLLPNRKTFKKNFVLKHYIGLSYDYLINKYVSGKREHSKREKSLFWGTDRFGFKKEDFNLNKKIKNLRIYKFDHNYDRNNPVNVHFWDNRAKKKTIQKFFQKNFPKIFKRKIKYGYSDFS